MTCFACGAPIHGDHVTLRAEAHCMRGTKCPPLTRTFCPDCIDDLTGRLDRLVAAIGMRVRACRHARSVLARN